MTKSEKFILAYNKIAIFLYVLKVLITCFCIFISKNIILQIFDIISCVSLFVALLNTLGIIKKEVLVDDNRIEYETSTPLMFIWLPRIIEMFILFVIFKNKQSISYSVLILSCVIDLILTAYSIYDRSKHVYVAEIERRDL